MARAEIRSRITFRYDACGKLELEVGDQHGFRRFFATTMLRNSVDVETVRPWGGWKSFNTMLRYLADMNATDSVTAMDQVFARMNDIVTNACSSRFATLQ